MNKTELIEYFEHIRYQVACYPRKYASPLPLFSGSGFMLDVDGITVFITAGHVATTHQGEEFVDDKLMTIQTNSIYKDLQNNCYGCILATVTGVVSIDAFKVDPESGECYKTGVVDVSFAQLDETRVKAPFVTQEIKLDGSDVKYGEPKRHIPSSDIVEINKDDEYFVFGRVNLFFENQGAQYLLRSEVVSHTNLKYIGAVGDKCILKYDKPVIVKYWKGLSGSPVLNQDGKLIGVACSVDPIANTLHVMPMHRILPMIRAEIINNSHNAVGPLRES